jgi:hypothetical protein
MSNFRAIATVTATLSQMLDSSVGKDVPGATVTTQRPDAATGSRVNLYLYQVTPNSSLRNTDLPNRRSEGELVQRPQEALNLNYLLTFYGDEGNLEPQRLLGSVVRIMHARGVLTRKMIRDAITKAGPNLDLADSDLADQIELVKLTLIPLSTEELSKLWSVFFQTPYNLSIAYQATVVLIESEESTRIALPVKERNFYVVPFRQPVIEQVMSKAGANLPIVAGSTLIIRGKQLRGDITKIRIGGKEEQPDTVIDTEISLQIPAGLKAGVQGVQVVHQTLMGAPPVPHPGVESNLAAFVLHPGIKKDANGNYEISIYDIQADAGNIKKAKIAIRLNPEVGKRQRVVLLLNDFQPISLPAKSYSFNAEPITIFNWDKIIKEDNNENFILVQFLKRNYDIDWVKEAKISIIDDKTIKVYTENNFLTLKLNTEKTRVNLEIDGIGKDEFIAKIDNGELIIYTSDIDTIEFHIENVVPGDYLVRVQIDGAESLLDVDANTKQYISPKVKIP